MPKINYYILFLFCFGLIWISPTNASSVNGTIDSDFKYAWGENIGWLNFDATNSNVLVTDFRLTGYVWSEDYGWINLSPTNSGVINDNEGNLSGYAWGENIGWIDFSGVTIDSTGRFTGTATNTISGIINFDCTNCGVVTDWRPRTVRPACNNSIDDDGDNKIDYPDDQGCRSEIDENEINEGGPGILIQMTNQPVTPSPSPIPETSITAPEDSTLTDQPLISPEPLVKQPPSIVEIITTPVKNLITELLLPEKPTEEIPIEQLVPKEAPLALKNTWNLLSSKQVEQFVFNPLPTKISKLTQKFPSLKNTFNNLGISKVTDLQKLSSAHLTLPGLTERLSLPTVKTEPGKFTIPNGVPLANLSSQTKQEIPTEIVFAKTGGELIDFSVDLTINDKGDPQQKITTITNKPLELIVKPEKPVKSIKGYIVFKSKKPRENSLLLPFRELSLSLFMPKPALAQTVVEPTEIEEVLVLMEFEYTDPDGDGIFTANIDTPIVDGEYEIITIMDFENPQLGSKEIRMTTVVDPEGYVFTSLPEGKVRIAGAIISLYWLNPETKQYELWPATQFQQENPQITDDTGKYSFLVPTGIYYLKAEAPNYSDYKSDSFTVSESSGIHTNIQLKNDLWWFKNIDWKFIIIIIFGLLLLYNFYRDKIRERSLNRQLK